VLAGGIKMNALGGLARWAGNVAQKSKEAMIGPSLECSTMVQPDEMVSPEEIQDAVRASLPDLGDLSVTEEEMDEAVATMREADPSREDQGWWAVTEGTMARFDQGTGLSAIKCSLTIDDVSPEMVVDALFGLAGRKEWDRNVLEISTLQTLDTTQTEIRYEVFQWPSPLWNRDNVARLRIRREKCKYGTSMTIMCETIKDPRIPGTTDRVRCWGRTVCAVEPQSDGSCRVERLTLASPNGSIPSVVVNTTAPRLASSWMNKFREICKQKQQELESELKKSNNAGTVGERVQSELGSSELECDAKPESEIAIV